MAGPGAGDAATDADALLDDGIVGLKFRPSREACRSMPAAGADCWWTATQLLRQAIKKLVDNAISLPPAAPWKYGPRTTAVRWRSRWRQWPWPVAGTLEQCLMPFVQDDMSYGGTEGLGLGLPIAKAICEAHGGALICRSAPGEGMTATIRLPAREARTADAA
jgi:K+-sensing histidine kinase KdpD